MEREGPPLEALLRRIAETPADFSNAPRVAALAHDVMLRAGLRVEPAQLGPLRDKPRAEVAAVAALLTWFLDDAALRTAGLERDAVIDLLVHTARDLASQASAKKYIEDPERREEIARVALARLGLRPAGETRAQAEDRLTSVSGVERARVIQAARKAEARSREIREALARKAAEESADKWTRE